MDDIDPKHKAIKQAISFLQRERELYGDFTLNHSSDAEEEKQRNEQKNVETFHSSPPEKQESPNPQKPLEPSNPIYEEIDKCTTLEDLEAVCRTAETLQTDLKGTRLVFGVGNPHADLMLIGEAPGAEEDKQGKPFVGKAGQLLNQILEAINFKREDVYIANILKHRPPNNRNPKPEERQRSLPFLQKQIDLVEPKLILALGKVSAQTLLNKNLSLTKMRGSFHPYGENCELLATYHPAALLRHPKWKRPTWEDVQLLRKRYDELCGWP